jgi:asparagine synthase (glutamine-hydrolysing)
MCGIFIYCGKAYAISDLFEFFNVIKYRGPDASEIKSVGQGVIFGFHRLSIMDPTPAGMQPMTKHNATVVTNGEIYNWKQLAKLHNIELKTQCDTEIILEMYRLFGIKGMLQLLDGYFALAIYDNTTNNLYIARDPYGVRSQYIGTTKVGELFVASELKAISELCSEITQFPPGQYMTIHDSKIISCDPYHVWNFAIELSDENIVKSSIRTLLVKAVNKRVHADQEICCLLSGGLDSSLVSALVQKIFVTQRRLKPRPKVEVKDEPPASVDKAMLDLMNKSKAWKERLLGNHFRESEAGDSASKANLELLKTFSIGMDGSTDLKHARIVADWIGSDHYEITIKPDDFLGCLGDIVKAIESYDVTSVRASAGNYLICSYIRMTTKCRVVFNGDGSDELFCSYKYTAFAPTDDDFYKENIKLMRNIHYFDVLRSDKSTAGNGLEARTPFMDKELIDYCMRINPKLKRATSNRMEKYILRKAFENTGILPDEILWRKKEAFSDGISSEENSWHDILTKHFEKLISDVEFAESAKTYSHNIPLTKEALYYRRVFEKEFPGHALAVPSKWMPPDEWFGMKLTDPSARILPK